MVDDVFTRAFAIGEAEVQRAVLEADGDFNRIDFAAARLRWMKQLTDTERLAVEGYERAAERAGAFERCQPEHVEYLKRVGCHNPPPPDTVN